ncbi:hypothetical protein [Candidatus Odyssella acanthamoebae]|uniref:Uncharacterized protein n=1 Tax=Candidatus Odyssella acanthamoebae TaxID=91604 RepID=A0A077AWA3_9PROT|nr:hypothetical protein [Candidatus Paracaedibacter acanthamoebae]AIK96696.1 hypothetical protein ID47_08145 [Candidatus Paracaedibacter acanthamoebae]
MAENFIAKIAFTVFLAPASFVNAEDLPVSETSLHSELLAPQFRSTEELKTQLRQKFEQFEKLMNQRNLLEIEQLTIRQILVCVPNIALKILSPANLISIMGGSNLILYHPEKRALAEIKHNSWTLDSPAPTNLTPISRESIIEQANEDPDGIILFDQHFMTPDLWPTLTMIIKSAPFNKDQTDILQKTKSALTTHIKKMTKAHIKAQKKFNKYYMIEDSLKILHNLDSNQEDHHLQQTAVQLEILKSNYRLQKLKKIISGNQLMKKFDALSPEDTSKKFPAFLFFNYEPTASELEASENLEKLKQYLANKKEEADKQIAWMEDIDQKILFETLIINEIDRILQTLVY